MFFQENPFLKINVEADIRYAVQNNSVAIEIFRIGMKCNQGFVMIVYTVG